MPRPILISVWIVMALMLVGARASQAQLLHDTFANEQSVKARWKLSQGEGAWEHKGPNGAGSISVVGNGSNSNYWSCTPSGLKPNHTYRISFQARVTPGATQGCVIAGIEQCNRDFGVSQTWQTYTFAFTTPSDVSHAMLRLGQWEMRGTVYFASVTITEVQPVYTQGMGDGESLEADTYKFDTSLMGDGANSARTLLSHTAGFNSNRWTFGANSEVIYRMAPPQRLQTAASIALEVSYRTGGQCQVLASNDGVDWKPVGVINGLRSESFTVPASLFPTPVLSIKLVGQIDPSAPANGVNFQVDRISYTAQLAPGEGQSGKRFGSTRFLSVQNGSDNIAVQFTNLGDLVSGAKTNVQGIVRLQAGAKPKNVTITWAVSGNRGKEVGSTTVRATSEGARFAIPYQCANIGNVLATLQVNAGSATLYRATTQAYVPNYYAADYGANLATLPGGALWWCESARKVAPHRAIPTAKAASVRLNGAGRERVAFQLVLRSERNVGPLRVTATDLVGPGGARIPANAVRLREVDYVRIQTPTDRIGVQDEWPDPLPWLDGAWHPKAARNNPLWITIVVPANTKPGDYRGAIKIAGGINATAPVNLHVWGFSLPETPVVRSGLGLSQWLIRQYHHIKTDADMQKQWDLYMRDFAEHRISTYDPMNLAPIKVEVTKPTADDPKPHVKFDFSAFDREAKRYLDGMRFTAFVIGFPGLGGGRYPNYDLGSYGGYSAGSPEYDRLMTEYGTQLQDHLEQNGWLSKAYVYWYDEPEVNDYPFVTERMKRLKQFAPKLKRMLTEEFQEPLYGSVDLWCPLTPNFSTKLGKPRQALGEEVWWYICCGPREPFCTEFIDHPAIEQRMWLWQTWKYGVQGILIWETAYWTSAQLKDKRQDPWQDPMSYADTSGTWGNGDGRFFYPPRVNGDTAVVARPIDSLRWELLGEGVQDYTYFYLLKQAIDKAGQNRVSPATIAKAQALLAVPEKICRDMTNFTTDPVALDAHKARIAAMIEALSR